MKLEVQSEANPNLSEHHNVVVLDELLQTLPLMQLHLLHYPEPLEVDLEAEQGDRLEPGHLQQFLKQLHHNNHNVLIDQHPKWNQQHKIPLVS